MKYRLNISEAISHYSKYCPNKIAFDGEFLLSYRDLDNNIQHYTNFLLNEVGENKKIGILLSDNQAFIYSLVGIMRSNNIFVLINPSLNIEDISQIVKNCECDCIITNHKININTNIYLVDDIETSKKPTIRHNHSNIEDIAGILFSSGTTGLPKGIVKTHYSILSEIIMWNFEMQINKETKFLLTRPLFYTGGFLMLSTLLFSGATVILQNKFSTKELIDYADSITENIDWAFLVPDQISQMLQLANNSTHKIAKKILVMGAAIEATQKVNFGRIFNCSVIESWGNTEGLGTITDLDDLQIRPKSIGRPFIFDEMCIVDESLNVLESEQLGYLAGMSDNLFSCYTGDDYNEENSIYRSDDIGYKDTDNYFYIVGRLSDKINYNGHSFFPREVEPKILEFDFISDCTVIGIPVENSEKIPVAVIMLKEQTEYPKDILKTINDKLSIQHKIFDFMQVSNIPRNQGGKILKNELIQQYISLKGTLCPNNKT